MERNLALAQQQRHGRRQCHEPESSQRSAWRERLRCARTGEAGATGAPPALVLAALDALRPLGVATLDMPLTQQRLWQAIQAARR